MDNKSINFVSRKYIRAKVESKSSLITKAIQKIQKGGKALEVSFRNDAELTYIRNIIYAHNKKNGENIKSWKDSDEKVVFFYK